MHMLHTSYTHEDIESWPTLSVTDFGRENISELLPFAKYTSATFRMFMKANGHKTGSADSKRLFFPYPANITWDGELREKVGEMHEIEKQLFRAWLEEQKMYWDVKIKDNSKIERDMKVNELFRVQGDEGVKADERDKGRDWDEDWWERLLECRNVRKSQKNCIETWFWEEESDGKGVGRGF